MKPTGSGSTPRAPVVALCRHGMKPVTNPDIESLAFSRGERASEPAAIGAYPPAPAD
ncbi:hypothetical protein [Candidatus Pantoea deserta]|uniref:hypothetical protein n=1 Tax=Candidatus Pantoea deserta TaxID=1869313 RepID=UPI00131A1CF7|nr:hypothetical protein [Pantoea deserta]